jgi:hypothetical protein
MRALQGVLCRTEITAIGGYGVGGQRPISRHGVKKSRNHSGMSGGLPGFIDVGQCRYSCA